MLCLYTLIFFFHFYHRIRHKIYFVVSVGYCNEFYQALAQIGLNLCRAHALFSFTLRSAFFLVAVFFFSSSINQCYWSHFSQGGGCPFSFSTCFSKGLCTVPTRWPPLHYVSYHCIIQWLYYLEIIWKTHTDTCIVFTFFIQLSYSNCWMPLALSQMAP